ncbi:hypothetical protein [Streptomyces sp. NPDC002172]
MLHQIGSDGGLLPRPVPVDFDPALPTRLAPVPEGRSAGAEPRGTGHDGAAPRRGAVRAGSRTVERLWEPASDVLR